MKSLQEKIDVMQHYDKCGKVESRGHNTHEWWNNPEPLWNWETNDYRIKPEPEYVPFDITDAADIVGKIFRNGNEIYGVTISGVILLCFTEIPYEELLTHYPFADGSRCGKLKQP
jgi:hypothetical protein